MEAKMPEDIRLWEIVGGDELKELKKPNLI